MKENYNNKENIKKIILIMKQFNFFFQNANKSNKKIKLRNNKLSF